MARKTSLTFIIMKKNYLLLLFISFFIFSCDKRMNEINNYYDGNTLIPIVENSKSSSSYYLFVNLGHSASGCSGCVRINGITMHVACQGAGSECAAKAAVTLSPDSANRYTATTIYSYDLTTEDFFLMPDRSLFVEMNGKDEVWLNIPGQLAIRDTVSEQFSFYDLFYSNGAVYKNQ